MRFQPTGSQPSSPSPFSGATYAVGGALALIASWLLTGCEFPKFGSRVKENPPPSTLTGWYETAPQKLTFCATFQGADPTHPTEWAQKCDSQISPAYVPDEVAKRITDPIAYVAEDSSFRQADDTSKGFNLTADGGGKDMELLVSHVGMPWLVDERCSLRFDFEMHDGNLRPDEPGTGHFSMATKGRVDLFFRVTRAFEGPCETTLASMRDCYASLTACPVSGGYTQSDLQGVARSTFQQWIQLGLMTEPDIATVRAIGYEVQYQ